MEKKEEEKLDRILRQTEEGYDLVAEKFSQTRSFFWRDLDFFRGISAPEDKVLDFGCGNGRLFSFLKEDKIDYWGVDVSEKLLEIARRKNPEIRERFFKISGRGSLPFSDDFFNIVFSVAVFHHLPPEHSLFWAREIFRVVRPGGKVVATAWNLRQRRFWRYFLNRKKFLELVFSFLSKKEEESFWETTIPFKYGKKTFHRYHRAYSPRSFSGIFRQAGFEVKESRIVGGKNIFVLAEKPIVPKG